MARLPGQTGRDGGELPPRGGGGARGWGGEEGVEPPTAQHRRDPDELEAEIARAPPRHGAAVRAGVEPAPEMKLEKAQGEVDAALDGEWQRAPDAAVDLHEYRPLRADAELDHREPRPAQRGQQPPRVAVELRVQLDALAQRAGAAGDRDLVQAAMLEGRERPPAVGEQLDADSLAGPILLQQDRAAPVESHHLLGEPARPVRVGDLQPLDGPIAVDAGGHGLDDDG